MDTQGLSVNSSSLLFRPEPGKEALSVSEVELLISCNFVPSAVVNSKKLFNA